MTVAVFCSPGNFHTFAVSLPIVVPSSQSVFPHALTFRLTHSIAIVKALRTEYVETPLGKIKFDEKGDAIGVGFSVYQVKNGKYVEVK